MRTNNSCQDGHSHYAIAAAVFMLWFSGFAQAEEFSPAFREMLPDVSYSATRDMRMEGRGIKHSMQQKVVYTPRKEWTSMTMNAMGDMVTLNLYDTGESYVSFAGSVTKTSKDAAPSLDDSAGHSANLVDHGSVMLDGVRVRQREFSYRQTQDGENFDVSGMLFTDSDGIPRKIDWTVVSDGNGTLRMIQKLSNVEVGPQDASLFVPPQAGAGGGGMYASLLASAMSGEAGAAGATQVSGMSGGGAIQTKTVRGKVASWPGGEGVLVNDDNKAVGTISADGSFEWKPTHAPKSGLYSLEDSFACEGVTLVNGSAQYKVIGGEIGVTDTSGNRQGRILGASSGAVVQWSRNRREVPAVPGYRVRLMYVDQPASVEGVCVSNVQKITRNQSYQRGWNIERDIIVAVGESQFFPVDAPTEVIWETIDSAPSDTVWVYENFGNDTGNAAASNLPDPVQEVVDETMDSAEDEAKDFATSKIRRGLGRLFGN